MRLYLDDVRETPEGWTRAYSVNEAIALICAAEYWQEASLDHDLGDFAGDGGDGVHLVDWMVANQRFPARVILHTANPVGRENMARALQRHGFVRKGMLLELSSGHASPTDHDREGATVPPREGAVAARVEPERVASGGPKE